MSTLPVSPTAKRYEPSGSLVARPSSLPLASVATITAPPTGRGAHCGAGGDDSTGQTGPAVIVPETTPRGGPAGETIGDAPGNAGPLLPWLQPNSRPPTSASIVIPFMSR